MRTSSPVAGAALLLFAGCKAPERIDLQPYARLIPEDDPQFAPQPHRDNPLEVVTNGTRAWVSLQGSPDDPGDAVASVDLDDGSVRRITVGSNPTGLALSPDGAFVLVLNRFSNYASVIDTRRDHVVELIPTDFYATDAVFTPDGTEVWVTNRWRDAVQVWELAPSGHDLGFERVGAELPVGSNPRDLAISADGNTVAVGLITGLTVSLIDVPTRAERARITVGAPVNDVAFMGDYLVVATLSASSNDLPFVGPDSNHDGLPGDGTPNANFNDLQNELAVYRVSDGEEVHRYTSDTTCCKDFRDVDPTDPARFGELLPPEDTWIVKGALPEQLAVDGDTVWVGYSGSDQLQAFTMDPATGALTSGAVWDTHGHNPYGLAVAGDQLLVASRLSEVLELHDPAAHTWTADIVVGDLSGGSYPATDAEIGELYNNVTSRFTVDGDGVCVACHREGNNIAKAFSMPLSVRAGQGTRQTMAARGGYDTRPWFFEASMDQTNFRPVMNEIGRVENFCCTDYTLFPAGAPADCATNPPAVCMTEPNASTRDGFAPARGADVIAHPRPTSAVTRDAFYLGAASEVIGRTTTFGDGAYFEDLMTGERRPLPLDFDGVTRSLGVFFLQRGALLPNPNDPDLASVRRGKALFERSDVACAVCHPAPGFAISDQNNPNHLPVRMGPVVSPNRNDEGVNLDLTSPGFVQAFPLTEVDTCEDVCAAEDCAAEPTVCDDLRDQKFGVTPLRGIWDRAPAYLHDGRAKSLKEVLATPGHPALAPGETGYNELDGIPNTNGATSHLTAQDLDDLIAYMLTL